MEEEDLEIKEQIKALRKENKVIAYIDEVGRGCIFGSVVTAAVILKDDFYNDEIDDSKKVKPEKREELAKIIKKNVYDYSYGIIEADELNEIQNIHKATKMAMVKALHNLSGLPDIVFIDGRDKIEIDIEQRTVKGGDRKVFGIAAASILAKTYRDNVIVNEYADKFPKYKLASNKGYPSPHHRMAVRKYGPTEFHRVYLKQMKEILDGTYDKVIEEKYKDKYQYV